MVFPTGLGSKGVKFFLRAVSYRSPGMLLRGSTSPVASSRRIVPPSPLPFNLSFHFHK